MERKKHTQRQSRRGALLSSGLHLLLPRRPFRPTLWRGANAKVTDMPLRSLWNSMIPQALLCLAFLCAVPAQMSAQTSAPMTTCNKPQNARTPSPQRVAAMQAMKQACAADMAQFCAGVPAQCGERHQCLMSHAAQLSPACAGAMQNLRATH
jgi:hypothetical protein